MLVSDVDDACVMVALAESVVGLPGAVKLFVLLSSGQTSRPQARSVGQQPPPRDAGHDLKPDEQASVFGGVELLDGAAVVDGRELELDGGGGATVVLAALLDELALGLEVDVGLGVTITTAVLVAAHPS